MTSAVHRRKPVSLLLLLLLARAAGAQTPGEALHKLFDTDWVSAQPAADAWPDMGLDALIAREAQDRERLEALRRIGRDSLRGADRTLYDLFERQLEMRTEQFRTGLHYTPFWSDPRLRQPLGVFSPSGIVAQLRSPQKIERLPAFLDQLQFLLRRGMEAGLLPSRQYARVALSGVGAEDLDFGRFIGPLRPATRETIEQKVRPALVHYEQFLRNEYLPKCPESSSISQWPRGRDAYALLIRRELGLKIDPETLHRSGLTEAARLRGAMEALLPAIGFAGSLDEFLQDVYSNPRFYYTGERQLVDAYRDAYERTTKQLDKVTRADPLPPLRFEPIRDPLRAALYTAGGRVGVDISDLALRPRFEVLSIALHEGPPGHHLQVGYPSRSGLSAEESAIRQSAAYAEGWGLYAESLGEDMGLYSDLYEKFGQLSQDLLRAVRMVIDTGVHGLGWTEDEAAAYVVAQTGRPRIFADAEVARLRNPATQSAYKAGEQVFQRLRDRAEQTLGDAFDLASFHDTILNWGVLPMEVLEKRFGDCLREACFTAASQ